MSTIPQELRRVPGHWQVLPFSEAVKDVTSGNTKLAKKEYLDSGAYPIVDQGQALFGGYTDDSSALCKSRLPTIIFGDHTRAFKYIETPFSLGADGAKVLEPKIEGLDKRFLFHYFRHLKIEAAGYSRHFKFLKEKYIPIPPLDEQKHIAAILDKADAIRQKRKQAIVLADEFLRSVFLEMFGDIPAKVSPYPFVGCRSAVSASSGKSSKSVIADFKTEIPIYGGNGVNGYAHESLYNEPVVVVGRVGQQCAITNLTEGPCWVTDNAIVIQINDESKYDAAYLAHAFIHSPIRNSVTQLDLPFINQSMILDYPIPLPPIEEQRKFSAIRTKLKEHMSMQTTAFEQSEVQFNALSQKAFSGQL